MVRIYRAEQTGTVEFTVATDRYPTERERLIAAGIIRPYTSRPTLRLLPAERERYEREAREWLEMDRGGMWNRMPVMRGAA